MSDWRANRLNAREARAVGPARPFMRFWRPFSEMRNRKRSKAAWASRRTRAASNIIGMALAIALTVGIAGSVAYFLTQQTNVLTTQEGIALTGPRLIKAGNTDVLSLSIKNTGTSPLQNPKVTLTDVCKVSSGTTRSDAEISATTTVNPGATHGFNEELTAARCKTSSHTPNVEAGKSYIVNVEASAVGTGSKITEAISVTSRY